MFPLWLAIAIIFYFFVWLLILKTDKHVLLFWKKDSDQACATLLQWQ